MPASYQGTLLRSAGPPILDLQPPQGITKPMQRKMLDALAGYNRDHQVRRIDNSELEARIASYELAFKMQRHAPEATDLGGEEQHTLDMYGVGKGQTDDFGRRCLIARRLVERGVRFIQLYSGGNHNDNNWDAHGDLVKNHTHHAGRTDQPIAALLKDLKQRGLLESTLVVWGGEFGRQPTAEYAKGTGRDHNSYGFTMWMAGGGIKGGQAVGTTDELGAKAVEKPFHVKHLHATILHQMGIDHERLTYRYSGRDFRLTDVHGEVVSGILEV